MRDKKLFIFPLIFALVLLPVIVVALIVYQPNNTDDCNCPAAISTAPHSHGIGIARAVRDGMQLILNVSPAAELYQIGESGRLELCGGDVGEEMKHVTVDVNDARLNPGERLPVTVYLTIRRADSGTVVVERDAPAMYAPGHGYHFGDNFLLENDNAYSWTVTVSPVQALRQAGAQDVWREPVTWEGEFRLDADGNVIDKPAGVQIIGDVSQSGLHVTLGHQDAVPLYDVSENGDAIPQEIAPDSRYFVVDVTDHAVNYEEKLPGATVTLTFRCAGETFDVQAAPVISPLYGFHYGANVPLTPGEWQITVTVEALDFWRHAGAAVSLGREPVSATFDFAVAE